MVHSDGKKTISNSPRAKNGNTPPGITRHFKASDKARRAKITKRLMEEE